MTKKKKKKTQAKKNEQKVNPKKNSRGIQTEQEKHPSYYFQTQVESSLLLRVRFFTLKNVRHIYKKISNFFII